MLPFAGILAIVSTGQTMVIQQRGLDMSSAGVVSLGGVAMAILSASTGSVLLGAGLAVLLGAVVGVVNGLLVTRINITPLIATLAVNAVVIGAVRSLTGNAPIAVAPSVQTFSHALIGGLPCSLLLAVGFVLVAWLVMRKTSTGRCFVAVGVNPRSAEAAGLRVTFYQIGAYVASGVCFAVGGILLAGFIGNASHTAGEDYLLPAIAAVVVGGTPFTGGRGSVVASAIAALFMAQLGQMVLALGAGVAVQLLVQAATIVTATAIRFLPHLLAWMQKRLAPTWH
ncbi:ABC transporter permease [Paraburkholderia sp. GAS42]|uniref:ABC transporter permease n=1 Tax=Paraburkholderia sp. GAS42 TaxID=3035135 RepID=UPI003D1D5C7B